MKALIYTIYESDQCMADKIQHELEAEKAEVDLHTFPDGESLIRFKTAVQARELILVCSLNCPNQKLLPLIFFARTARDLGATKISLVTPYLAYMRQDKRFNEGEGISSRYFADMLSSNFSALITVDPHLHRYKSLSELYSIPTKVVSASSAIAEWIGLNVQNPYLIGPDAESEQWVADIAKRINAPYVILQKTRYGDSSVKVSMPEVSFTETQCPVLLDDILSSGRTMTEAAKIAQGHFKNKIICVAIHAVFSDSAYLDIKAHFKAEVGIELNLVTSNTVQHVSNQIDLSQSISDALRN